jgi:hypothetical protein
MLALKCSLFNREKILTHVQKALDLIISVGGVILPRIGPHRKHRLQQQVFC